MPRDRAALVRIDDVEEVHELILLLIRPCSLIDPFLKVALLDVVSDGLLDLGALTIPERRELTPQERLPRRPDRATHARVDFPQPDSHLDAVMLRR